MGGVDTAPEMERMTDMRVYADQAATTSLSKTALEAMLPWMTENFGNPSALYEEGRTARDAVETAREKIAHLLHAKAKEIYFTSGGTEADNLALLGTVRALRGRKGHFITTKVEHPAILETAAELERLGHSVTYIGVDEEGTVDVDALVDAVREDTALVSVMQVNNEVGAVMPIEEISRRVKEKNPRTLIHVDGVQGFMRVPMHMNRMGVDLYSLSGHKIHGPKGIGALAMSDRARPLCIAFGGGQENGLRSGTENVPGIAGLGQAVRAFARLDDPASDMMELKMLLRDGILQAVPDAKVNGPTGGAPHILNVTFPVKGEVLLHALEGAGILCSTGSACARHKKSASHVLTAMGVPDKEIDGALRFSLCPMNTPEEIDETVAQIRKSVEMLRAFKRR